MYEKQPLKIILDKTGLDMQLFCREENKLLYTYGWKNFKNIYDGFICAKLEIPNKQLCFSRFLAAIEE